MENSMPYNPTIILLMNMPLADIFFNHFINIIIMNRGKEVEEEYLNLRSKVEGRIKEL